jgi:hypothetical protein
MFAEGLASPGFMSGQGAAALLARISSLEPDARDDDDDLGNAGVLRDLGRAGVAPWGGDEGAGPEDEDDEMLGGEARVSRKDKSLGLLADNFLQLFASGSCTTVELEGVATRLGVGRRRIYDIVNVLESLDVVQKDRASSYTWLGLSKMPACVERLLKSKPIVELLVDDPSLAGDAINGTRTAGKENGGNDTGPVMGATANGAADRADKVEGRKEKSIRELSTKFVGLFLQAVATPGMDGVISLEQAARSLLLHESGGDKPGATAVEPDAGAMKTKVRRLYDICNVLTSLRMIEKIKLPDTSKPAFKWLGVTEETKTVFDASSAAARPIKAYGGGVNAPVCAKRGRPSTGGAGAQHGTGAADGGARRQSIATDCHRVARARRDSFEPPLAFAATPMPSLVVAAAAAAFPVPAIPVAPAAASEAQWRWTHAQAPPLPPPTAGAPLSAKPALAVARAVPCSSAAFASTVAPAQAAMPVMAQHPSQYVTAATAAAATIATAATAATLNSASAFAAFAPSAAHCPMLSPCGTRAPATAVRVEEGWCGGAPTPAHVQAELNGVVLDNTPRQAIAAMLTMGFGAGCDEFRQSHEMGFGAGCGEAPRRSLEAHEVGRSISNEIVWAPLSNEI